MKIQIKHRYTKDVIFEAEADSVKLAVVKAVEQGVSLNGADLSGQDLSEITIKNGSFVDSSFDRSRFDGSSFVDSSFDRSRFDGSSFVDSSFDHSNFVGSSFVDSSFDRSRFDGSRFDGSRFDGSSFDHSNFVDSSFVDSNFVGSSFVDSSFDRSRFDGSSFDGSSFDEKTATSLALAWSSAKADLWMMLLAAPLEVAGLLKALQEGRVNGSQYEGECACLVGTIANVRGCEYKDLAGIKPDSNRPSEIWFMGISEGDTPETSPIVKITAAWVEEWQKLFGSAVEMEAAK